MLFQFKQNELSHLKRVQAAVAKEYSQAIDDLGRSLEYKNIEKRTKKEIAYMREHGIKFVEY